MNINKRAVEKKVSDIFSVLGNPIRVQLLLAIGNGEACVCHLEAMLKKRQAFISQHLMALREAGLLETRRDGKYIFYRLADPSMLNLIDEAAKLAGMDHRDILAASSMTIKGKCPCPHCAEKEAEISETREAAEAADAARRA